jgi:hypothetical protein
MTAMNKAMGTTGSIRTVKKWPPTRLGSLSVPDGKDAWARLARMGGHKFF